MLSDIRGLARALLLTGTMILAISAGLPTFAHDPKPHETKETDPLDDAPNEERFTVEEEIEVRQRADDLLGVASSATEGVIGRADLARRPVLRQGELLETVPGVIITQHSGSGKANQYFLRGFNLDHGTDFRVEVNGVPVNNPSHGHGQGYTDLNFMIPELVDTIRFHKGPYFADSGDFSAAGAVEMDYVRTLDQPLIQLTGGSFDYGRGLIAGCQEVGGGDLLAALEVTHYDGPWSRPDDSERFSGVLRYSLGDFLRGFSITAMGYDNTWDSTDQIPRRAVDSGQIGLFDSLDHDLGGASSRYSLSAELHRANERSFTQWQGYLLRYDLELFSNFTYFLDDPVNGDEFRQLDERTVAGFKLDHHWHSDWGGRGTENSAGIEIRQDHIDNGLFRTAGRQLLSTTREDTIEQLGVGAYIQNRIRWSDKVRTTFGLRSDAYYADVESNLAANSGSADDWLLSPKLSVAFGPWNQTEFYVNAGYGFHSNDARGATIRVDPSTREPVEAVAPLVRAKGLDVGLRTSLLPGLDTSLTAFVLELESELVFVGDAGGTEASRPSRRRGIEWTNFYRARPWLSIDLDVAWSHARFTDNDPAGNHVPGALEQVVAAGISVDGLGNYFGSLRLRHFSAAPLIEDNSVRSGTSTLVNGRLGYRFDNGLSLALEVFNLLDERNDDITYFYPSRLPGEPAGGIEDIHFHPMEKTSVRLVMSWKLFGSASQSGTGTSGN